MLQSIRVNLEAVLLQMLSMDSKLEPHVFFLCVHVSVCTCRCVCACVHVDTRSQISAFFFFPENFSLNLELADS